MATDVVRQFHETWIGECQPSEGLTFSIPVLCDAGVMQRLDPAQAREFERFLTTPEPRHDRHDLQDPAECRRRYPNLSRYWDTTLNGGQS